MIGIHACGCYVPVSRVSAVELAAALGSAPRGLESLPVAAPDEDPLTMAVEAARGALNGLDATDLKSVRALALASTTLPYHLRVQVALVAGALGLSPEVVLTEHTTSHRAVIEGLYAVTGALRWAGVAADAPERALLVGADRPTGLAGEGVDGAWGAAAVALLVGRATGAELATVDAVASYGAEDPGLRFVRRGERAVRDVAVVGYAGEALREAVVGATHRLLSVTGACPADFQLAALGTLDPRSARSAARALGLADDQWQAVHPFPRVGDPGAAGPLISLVAALDAADPGDRILWVSYGTGSAADAAAVTVGSAAGLAAGRGRLELALAGGRDVVALEYLRLRGEN